MIKNALIFIVLSYKKLVSPFLRRTCRFYPSCSEYSREAIVKYGAIKGSALAAQRIMRCNGYFKGGYDPVR